MSAEKYLGLLQAAGVEPNHFISVEYLDAVGWKIHGGEVTDGEGFIFPPLVDGRLVPAGCMCDFEGYRGAGISAFWDYEFIYRAGDFNTLDGGKWKTFRKNVRKVKRQDPVYRPFNTLEAMEILVDWADEKGYVDDFETMLDYLPTVQCWGLTIEGRPVGFNAWDRNWRFVNYRYCITRVPYVSEYLRLMFYNSFPDDTMVNDGGTLGYAELERFKRKLNPREIRIRREWE